MAEGIQHGQTAQFARLQAAGPSGDQPETACLGAGSGYAVKCVNELGTKNQSGQFNRTLREELLDANLFMRLDDVRALLVVFGLRPVDGFM